MKMRKYWTANRKMYTQVEIENGRSRNAHVGQICGNGGGNASNYNGKTVEQLEREGFEKFTPAEIL